MNDKETECDKFKNTEIGRIPREWELARLEDIADEIFYGITAKATEENGGIKMLRTTDIEDFSVNWDDLPFCEITEKRNNLSKYFVKKGDLIVARAGTVGISVLAEEDFDNILFGSYLIKVRPSSKANPKFLHYFFQSESYWRHLTGAQGSTLKNINLPLLRNLKIPLPHLLEQQKIASILSTVDDAIRKTAEIIQKSQELRKGLMQQLLTKGIGHKEFKQTEIGEIPKEWKVMRLKNIGRIVVGMTPSTSVEEFWGGEHQFVTPTDFSSSKYVYKTERTVTKKGAKESKLIPRNSVLVTCIGSTIGKVVMSSGKCMTNQQINAIVCKNGVNAHYVYYMMEFRRKALRRLSGMTAKPIVNKSTFKEFQIPLPPLSEQQKIASILSTVDEKLELEKQRKEKLAGLKKGLMQDLLTGKVRVN